MVIVKGFIAGLLAFGAFAPISLWWLAPISLAFLLHALANEAGRERALIVFFFGIGLFAPLLSWSNIYVGVLPWILLFVLESLLLLPIALIPFSSQFPRRFLIFPLVVVLTEFISSRLPFGGFGWGRIGFSQADAPYSFLARWGGVPALSFSVALVALIIYFTFTQRLRQAVFLGGVVILLSLFSLLPNSKVVGEKTIVAVQGGVPSLGLQFNERAREVFNMHLKATEVYLSTTKHLPQIIVWPENAVDVDPFRDPIVNNDLHNLVDKWKIPLIIGAVMSESQGYSNASILWQPVIGPTSTYRKMHLTPFGEYIPLRKIAEFVSPLAKNVVDFQPGKDLTVHTIGNAVIGPIICYELLDDSLGRSISLRSNLLLVQTNSATFGRSPESRQQLSISRIRAIEHQKFIVSVSTTGVSAIITPNGDIKKRTELGEIVALESTVGLIKQKSFSDRYELWIEATLAGTAGLWILSFYFILWRRRRDLKP